MNKLYVLASAAIIGLLADAFTTFYGLSIGARETGPLAVFLAGFMSFTLAVCVLKAGEIFVVSALTAYGLRFSNSALMLLMVVVNSGVIAVSTVATAINLSVITGMMI